MIEAIPTLYRGTQYRSRLEARWAAFFHLVGWGVQYEPIDLNGWIPDFILQGKRERVAVDVKPIASMDDGIFIEVVRKIERSGWEGDALILGYLLPRWGGGGGELCIGWLGQFFDANEPAFEIEKNEWDWGYAILQQTNDPKILVGFCHAHQSYHERMSGHYPGGSTGGDEELVERLWAQAGNEVQWKG